MSKEIRNPLLTERFQKRGNSFCRKNGMRFQLHLNQKRKLRRNALLLCLQE